jgi:hypothetical protein
MEKFNFLIGNWDLEYRIPRRDSPEPGTDHGTGSFTRALDDRYVFFDYSTISGEKAHGIFAKDKNGNQYRYWWFENSGIFLIAVCKFLNENTLFLEWIDTQLTQTFIAETLNKVVLQMFRPTGGKEPEMVLEVILTRKV